MAKKRVAGQNMFITDYDLYGFIPDIQCSADFPVINGYKPEPVYGKGISIYPKFEGRDDSEHFRKIKLECIDPLESYDKIIVLFSGGKDSLACYLHLIELGVPKSKIELWHHDIDGHDSEQYDESRCMDWPCTQNYVKAVAEAEGVTLRVSYRQEGFYGELFRIGASKPIKWIDPDTGKTHTCSPTQAQLACESIRQNFDGEEQLELLKKYGYRFKWPAKGSILQGRWCSSALKVEVESALISRIDELSHDCRILVVSGERRGESVTRQKYNECEIHRCSSKINGRLNRIVHKWRCCVDWTERDVWEIIKRAGITCHPCYSCGWSRCSCRCCIFSSPKHYAGIRQLFPDVYQALVEDEKHMNFTIDPKSDLDTFVGDCKSCVCLTDKKALHSLLTGEFSVNDVYTTNWKFPAGAFHGGDGGSC